LFGQLLTLLGFGFGVAAVAKTANTMDINGVILAGVRQLFGIYLHGGKEFHQVLLFDWRICRAAIAHAGFGVVSWYKSRKDGGMIPSWGFNHRCFYHVAPHYWGFNILSNVWL
jgi:PiT family inorganic phosphate transporter